MTAFDFIVLGILIVSVGLSVRRSLTTEILSFVAWIVGFVTANLYGPWLAHILSAAIPSMGLRLLLGFLTVFIAAFVSVMVLNMTIEYIMKKRGWHVADRGLGGLFGLARGLLIVMTFVMLSGFTALPQQPMWRNAALAPLAVTAVSTIKPLMPIRMAAYVRY